LRHRYRSEVLALCQRLLQDRGPVASALDYGCGDGWFAKQFGDRRLAGAVAAVDVQQPHTSHCPVQVYDGSRLPFADAQFELVYALDVVHHTPDPTASLRELSRCTNRWLLLKDHNYISRVGWLTLAAMDEMGNRRFGVVSRYQYMRDWEWFGTLEESGFDLVELIHPARCHRSLLGWATNHLQFAGLWRRRP
jgi:SAM-dependent methyltransferase